MKPVILFGIIGVLLLKLFAPVIRAAHEGWSIRMARRKFNKKNINY